MKHPFSFLSTLLLQHLNNFQRMKKLTQTWRQQKPGSFPRNAAKEEAHEQLSNGATRTKRLGRLPVAVTSRKVVAAVSNTGKDQLQNGVMKPFKFYCVLQDKL